MRTPQMQTLVEIQILILITDPSIALFTSKSVLNYSQSYLLTYQSTMQLSTYYYETVL